MENKNQFYAHLTEAHYISVKIPLGKLENQKFKLFLFKYIQTYKSEL